MSIRTISLGRFAEIVNARAFLVYYLDAERFGFSTCSGLFAGKEKAVDLDTDR